MGLVKTFFIRIIRMHQLPVLFLAVQVNGKKGEEL